MAALAEEIRDRGRWRDVAGVLDAAGLAGAVEIRVLANVDRSGERVRLARIDSLQHADVPIAEWRGEIVAAPRADLMGLIAAQITDRIALCERVIFGV